MKYYTDDQIIIRDLIPEDVVFLFASFIDKEIYEHDPIPRPVNSKELYEWCGNHCANFENNLAEKDLPDKKFHYFIITNTNEQPIGFIIFFNVDKEKMQGEMGIEIGDKRYWRQGIALKAITEIEKHIFTTMNIKRIYIETGETNKASLKLFEKLKYTRCGEYMENDSFKFIVMEKWGK